MGILKKEPAGRVASADELMAIAHSMEREAGRRYRVLADRMRLQGVENLASLFTFLAGIEDKHADQVDVRARLIIGKTPAAANVKWELPESFDKEEAPAYLLTPYRALAIAVRNEERAFAFFSYLASGAEDERLRQLAEEFAKEELGHAALLRRERRKAWRREGAAGVFATEGMERPESVDLLRAQAAAMEQAAAEGHRGLAATLRASGDAATAALFESAAEDEESCAGELLAGTPERVPHIRLQAAPGSVRDGLRILEFAFEQYSDLAEHAKDEALMQEAQSLSERALKRLAGVAGAIDNSLIEAATIRE
jgi:rubrerythrin